MHIYPNELFCWTYDVFFYQQVRSLNFSKLLGGGVLHTKFWIVDRKHFYVGSANMDWRSLTQVWLKALAEKSQYYHCSLNLHFLIAYFIEIWLLVRKSSPYLFEEFRGPEQTLIRIIISSHKNLIICDDILSLPHRSKSWVSSHTTAHASRQIWGRYLM